jgi:hypothetical protein
MAKRRESIPSVTAELGAIAADEAQAEVPRNARKSTKKDRSKTVRLTIDVSREVNFRLESIAAFKRRMKGALAAELIDRGLTGYKADVSLISMYQEIHSQPGEAA